MRNRKLIQWSNGKFGIRYGLICHTFQDFKCTDFQWSLGDDYIKDCMTDEETARKFVIPTNYKIIKG